MSRTSFHEVEVSALDSTLALNSSKIGETESHLASKNLKKVTAAENLLSSECYLLFAIEALDVMPEQVQFHRPRLHGTEFAHSGAESAYSASDCIIQSLAALEAAYHEDVN